MSQVGHHVTAVQGDVSDLADLDRLYATVKKEKGILDMVFANAGIGAVAQSARLRKKLLTSSSM